MTTTYKLTSKNLLRNIHRVFLCGFLFVVFGVICILGNCVFLPIVALRLQRFRVFRNIARDLVFVSWRFFLFCAFALGYLRYEFSGLNRLGRPSELIVANHPSLIDVVFLLSRVRRINCVAKASLLKNIFLFGALKASGYITNENEEKLLESCLNSLKNGECLLIFPEGTRTQGEIRLHKAASYIAIHGAKILTPIYIHMYPKSLNKNNKWYDTPNKRIKFNLYTLPEINIKSFAAESTAPVRVRALHEELKIIYHKESHNESSR